MLPRATKVAESKPERSEVDEDDGLEVAVPDLAADRETPLEMTLRLGQVAQFLEDVAQIRLGTGLSLPVADLAGQLAGPLVVLLRLGGSALVVEDDGKGFNYEELVKNPEGLGIGLISMKERVSAFDGVFTLSSAIDKGTEILIEIPCEVRKRI